VKQIGDAPYPLAKHKNDFIPRSERLLFEQQVYSRPIARFRNNNRMSYCLNDALVPQDATTTDGQIMLQGTPPFELQISIKNLAASKVETEIIKVHGTTWTVSLPQYTFGSIGPHLITIESVQDASRCEQAALDPLYRSIWVDVAETAAIIPINRREDFCVGEISYFQLEGIPPWTIGSVHLSYTIMCSHLRPYLSGIASMANLIHRRPKSPPSLYSSSSLVNSPSLPWHINKRRARLR
jgi:nucleoporin POM152